jgi:hypothetical protein
MGGGKNGHEASTHSQQGKDVPQECRWRRPKIKGVNAHNFVKAVVLKRKGDQIAAEQGKVPCAVRSAITASGCVDHGR